MPATAARRRRAGAARRRPRRRRAIESATTTGRTPANAAATSPAASPMATTARIRRRPRRAGAEVEALVAAAGDQHDGVESRERRQRGVRRRRLGVVVPPHASMLAHQRHAMGEARERTQRCPAPVDRGAAGHRPSRRAARAFATSCGSARHSSSRCDDQSAGPDQGIVVDVVVAPVGARTSRPRARSRGTQRITTGSSALATATSPCALVTPDAGLGPLVGVERGVGLEMVRCEVQPRADAGGEPGAVLEPERRRLDHEHLDGGVVDGSHQRDLGVAGRHRPAPAASSMAVTSVVTVVLPSVPVTATHWARVPLPRQVELAAHRRPGRRRQGEHGVVRRDPRARQHRVGAAHQVVQLRGGRRRDQRDADDVGRRPAAARSTWSSVATTSWPRRTRARATAWLVTANPTSTALNRVLRW